MSVSEKQQSICPESTLESANRRNFIRKAALVTAAAGVGAAAALDDRKILPESSARSSSCTVTTCNPIYNADSYLAIWSSETTITGCLGRLSCPRAVICSRAVGHCYSCPGRNTAFGVLNVYNLNCCINDNPVGLFATTEARAYVEPPSTAGVYGGAKTGIGVLGVSCNGTGVLGRSGSAAGVSGVAGSSSALPLEAIGYNSAGEFAICSKGNVLVDYTGKNSGALCHCTLPVPGIQFGVPVSGEGITSNRTCASGNNLQGLCLWTSYHRRVSITNSGNVGIGTISPTSKLEVISGSCPDSIGVNGRTPSTSGIGVLGIAYACSGCTIGVWGVSCSPTGVGVEGDGSVGVKGESCRPGGIAVYGYAFDCGAIGVKGQSCLASGIGVQGVVGNACAIPIVAKGAPGQVANLQQWENSCGTVFAVINRAGSLGLGGVTKPNHVLCISGKAHASSGFGIGTSCINTTLAVHGSVSTKARVVTGTTAMATTDYAILASASTGGFTVTLPAAGTPGACNGMIVFIKKTDSTANEVTVAAESGDTIEGAPSKALTKQYDFIQLISNGAHEWFISGSAKCGAFVS